MADHHQIQIVCCMCGDVGFPDKLFRCTCCCYRFQHSYCSNYYREASEECVEVCDWCKSEGRNSRNGSSSKKSVARSNNVGGFTNQSGERDMDNNVSTVKARKIPSPRPTARRYKLLKDVMC